MNSPVAWFTARANPPRKSLRFRPVHASPRTTAREVMGNSRSKPARSHRERRAEPGLEVEDGGGLAVANRIVVQVLLVDGAGEAGSDVDRPLQSLGLRLDGHVHLGRAVAEGGRWPRHRRVDVAKAGDGSRLAPAVLPIELDLAAQLRAPDGLEVLH